MPKNTTDKEDRLEYFEHKHRELLKPTASKKEIIEALNVLTEVYNWDNLKRVNKLNKKIDEIRAAQMPIHTAVIEHVF